MASKNSCYDEDDDEVTKLLSEVQALIELTEIRL